MTVWRLGVLLLFEVLRLLRSLRKPVCALTNPLFDILCYSSFLFAF